MSLDDELQAFVEDRKEHVANVIAPSLTQGKIVVLDRYFYSTIAYQGARGASRHELSDHMKSFAPIPDVVLLLDADPAVTLSRIANGRGETPNEFERIDELTKVRSVFSWLADTHDEIARFDGHHPIGFLHGQIVEALTEGVFKRFTAKDYDCDCMYCVHREARSCRWFTLQQSLRSQVAKLTATN